MSTAPSLELNPLPEAPPDAPQWHNIDYTQFSMSYRKPAYPVTIMMPYLDGIRGPVVASMLYYAKHLDVGFELVGNTVIASARNELADRFLRSNATWSFWVDSDVFLPFGNADAFNAYTSTTKGRQFTEHNALVRLLSHKQPLVGGVYAGRFKRSPLTIQPDLAPRNPNDSRISQSLREGNNAGGLQPVDWIAAGCMLVHRKVFEKIMETQPIEPRFKKDYYPFFTAFPDTPGHEDIAFCTRAKEAGAQPLLDTEVRCGHIGLSMFLCEDSEPPPKR
jgi:hypothetical protein